MFKDGSVSVARDKEMCKHEIDENGNSPLAHVSDGNGDLERKYANGDQPLAHVSYANGDQPLASL